MAEVNLHSWSEISQASEGLQLNSTAATLEHILARFARLETRLVEHERRVAATLPPLQPEPDPPDRPRLYAASQPQTPPHRQPSPPYQPDSPTSTMDCYHQLSHTYDKQCWNQPPQPIHPRPATCWVLPDCANLSYGYQQTPTYAPEPYPYAYNPPRQQGYPGYDQPPPRLHTSWDPPGPSCWYPPTSAFEQPSYTYIDSYAPLQIPYTGEHREQPDYQRPRLPYTDSESLVQPRNCSSGYHPWQPENFPSLQLPFPDLPLHSPSPPTPRPYSCWDPPEQCTTQDADSQRLSHIVEADVSGGKRTTWSGIGPYLTSCGEKSVNKEVYQQGPPNITCSGDISGQSSIELQKESFVQTVVLSSREDTSPSDDGVIVVADCQENKRKAVEPQSQPNELPIKEGQTEANTSSDEVKNDIAYIYVDLHAANATSFDHQSSSFDDDARWIPPRNKRPVLALDIGNHIGPPLMFFVEDDEGRRSTIWCVFDPEGDPSTRFSLSTLFVASWFPP